MPQLVISRREFAGVPVTLVTATIPSAEPDQPHRIVARGRISRSGGQITISDRLTSPAATVGR